MYLVEVTVTLVVSAVNIVLALLASFITSDTKKSPIFLSLESNILTLLPLANPWGSFVVNVVVVIKSFVSETTPPVAAISA